MPYKVSSEELEDLYIAYTNVPKILVKLSRTSSTLFVSDDDYCNIITHPSFIQHYMSHASVSKEEKSFVWQGIEVACEDVTA